MLYTSGMAKDVDLFAAAMADVKPLKDRRRRERAVRTAPPPSSSSPAASTHEPPRGTPRASAGGRKRVAAAPAPAVPELTLQDAAFDRDLSRALSRGRLVPQASLDLHGMTVAGAERAVARFLEDSVGRDLRVVLIVTGKGLRLEGGRLFGGRIRAEFLGWLNRADNRERVRGVRPAHARHGGGGAFYVLLRRRASAARSSASSRSLRATPQR
ncbi:MAG: Smr/MutS family protein [Pseudomonadota bacterium]